MTTSWIILLPFALVVYPGNQENAQRGNSSKAQPCPEVQSVVENCYFKLLNNSNGGHRLWCKWPSCPLIFKFELNFHLLHCLKIKTEQRGRCSKQCHPLFMEKIVALQPWNHICVAELKKNKKKKNKSCVRSTAARQAMCVKTLIRKWRMTILALLPDWLHIPAVAHAEANPPHTPLWFVIHVVPVFPKKP